ncbi:hypothetical protein SFUMM280S_02577 [Streptomyces fumanus]
MQTLEKELATVTVERSRKIVVGSALAESCGAGLNYAQPSSR